MDKLELLFYIRQGGKKREAAIRSLYDDPQLRTGLKKVLFLGEENDEFYDVLNLTLVQFMKTVIRNPNFTIDSNVNSYLFVIARNISIAKHKRNKLGLMSIDESHTDISDAEPTIDLKILDAEKMDRIRSLIATMGRNCYEILWNWASGYDMAEISKRLEYNSAEVIRRKKFVCLKRLSAYLEQHPEVKESLK